MSDEYGPFAKRGDAKMPRILMVVKPSLADLIIDYDLDELGKRLISAVEKEFGIAEKNATSFLCLPARSAINEEGMQIEVGYTAGRDLYGWQMPFDPDFEAQERVAKAISSVFNEFILAGKLPQTTLSVFCQPLKDGHRFVFRPKT